MFILVIFSHAFLILPNQITGLTNVSSLCYVSYVMAVTDMKDVRNYLMSEALPELREFCSQNGMYFHLIDLNWGMSEHSICDPDMSKIALQQLHLCHNRSSGPFYVVSAVVVGLYSVLFWTVGFN